MATSETVILDQAGVNRALTRIAPRNSRAQQRVENLVLVGIRSGGVQFQLNNNLCTILKVCI